MNDQKQMHVEVAKFIQNILLENNIKCYLIGGALINAVRDDGILRTDDIDFAIINDEDIDQINKIIPLTEKYLPYFTWNRTPNFLSINVYADENKKIDFFKFSKKYLNYYMYDLNWIHERICHFQTFKKQEVILENKNFLTMYRPDLFLKTVYGDYSKPTKEYKNLNGGNTEHVQECDFYITTQNFNIIDFRINNLKLFFNKINVKTNLRNIDENKINVFDESYYNFFDNKKYLFYNDFKEFLIKENVNFDNF